MAEQQKGKGALGRILGLLGALGVLVAALAFWRRRQAGQKE
ncbi:MAG: hypothetical protein RQ985_02165 [Dehalococcoidia bacterium]|jgi:hypothetical protein|nr:hypothetical protein [Dehalococcoidia bacterium]